MSTTYTPEDRFADNGNLINRGFLELEFEDLYDGRRKAYFNPDEPDETGTLRLSLYIQDAKDNGLRDLYGVYYTKVPVDTDIATKQRLLKRFMDVLLKQETMTVFEQPAHPAVIETWVQAITTADATWAS